MNEVERSLLRRIEALESALRRVERENNQRPVRWAASPAGAGGAFIARITGRTQDGSNKRWSYSFVEQVAATAGLGGLADLDGGRTGTVYNLIEFGNGASGLWFNGVHSENLVGTFDLQPIPTGARVWVWPVTVVATGAVQYLTLVVNQIDGECE